MGIVLFKKDDSSAAEATKSATALAEDSPTVQTTASTAPKGRPTPTRKEAEAARKAALRGNAKPGASKKEARANEREQMRVAREKNREAMLRGDESALPLRDRGPAKKFARDFVDSHRTAGEFFVPVAIVVLLLGITGNIRLQVFVTMVWILIIVIVVADTSYRLWAMNRQLKAQIPNKADRKGVNFYAIMRMLQIRRLRIPPPRFKAGGQPVTPKRAKSAKN